MRISLQVVLASCGEVFRGNLQISDSRHSFEPYLLVDLLCGGRSCGEPGDRAAIITLSSTGVARVSPTFSSPEAIRSG